MSNLAESQPLPTDPSDLSVNPPLAELNRAVLNELTNSALVSQTYFGRGLELSSDDKTQLELVVASAKTVLKPAYEEPGWGEFEALVSEGQDKGVLLSFTTHERTNVPTWCIDGGQEATVKKVKTDAGQAAIEVPSSVYNLYHWTKTVEAVEECATTSNETLRGRATKPLGTNLQQLAHLIGKSDIKK